MALTRENPFELLVDSHHGQYMGQVFAETVKRELFPTISAEDWAILETGPDHELYSELCAELDQHSTEDGVSLWWDGDLWAVDWSLIGDPDQLADLGAEALDQLCESESTRALIADLIANLRDGPGFGRWSQELLRELRERVELVADQISESLPMYYSTWDGIAERDIDVESLLIAESPELKLLSQYW